MVPMEIQPFTSTQLDTLYKIDQECFSPGISYTRKELARFIQHKLSKTWVAHSGNQIIGFVILGREPQKVGHIVTIDVVQSARGTGVGSALMKMAEDWARRHGLHLIYLETAEDNRLAQSFYMTRGYAKVEEIPDYYSSGQTAWVMVKYL